MHKKLVCDIESCLDSNNYDVHEPARQERVYTAYLERPKRKKDTAVLLEIYSCVTYRCVTKKKEFIS